jgi:hypothetical protein
MSIAMTPKREKLEGVAVEEVRRGCVVSRAGNDRRRRKYSEDDQVVEMRRTFICWQSGSDRRNCDA